MYVSLGGLGCSRALACALALSVRRLGCSVAYYIACYNAI